MTELPILFSGEMVRAILGGRKSQTRRVIKPQPKAATRVSHIALMPPKRNGQFEELWWDSIGSADGRLPRCPYGVPGDQLWVRECFCEYGRKTIYRADFNGHTPISDGIGGPWKPSIHMPRWASRLTLKVTGVRVERVQEITNADILAEGLPPRQPVKDKGMRSHWQERWDALYAKRGFGWETNPWVWLVEFERLP